MGVFGAIVLATTDPHPAALRSLSVSVQPQKIAANGYDTAEIVIDSGASKPTLSLAESARGAVVEDIRSSGGRWHARLRAGVNPGPVHVRIDAAGYRSASGDLIAVPDNADSVRDGMPDFLRLDDSHDRHAFRQWFTWLAEAQYFQPAATRPPEITDCAALVRYAYREALHRHDSAWANSAGLMVVPALDSIEKYEYPFTPLHANLFRTRPGPYVAADAVNGAFRQFADAETLWRYNASVFSRDLSRAQPGDLLFFRQAEGREPFHTMIYVGKSQLRPDGERYVLYHTGPTGKDPGEMRRLTVEQLLRFPQPEWRPVASNSSFLGIARWNILRTVSGD
jgi:uncharacterized protein YfaT (DUF1175 family)